MASTKEMTDFAEDVFFENNTTLVHSSSTTEYNYFYNNSSESDNNNSSAIFTISPDNILNNRTSSTNFYYSYDDAGGDLNNTSSGIVLDTITTTPITGTFMNSTSEMVERQLVQFWIGVGLSISSSVFIGLSFIIKKKALIRLSKGGKRANQGGYGYLKDLLWWSGLLSMAIGEAANFMAYTFAPASLVSTLGVLSVLVTAILSSKYLHERLNFLGKIGCFLCTIGSTVIVVHAPMEKDIESMEDLQAKLTNFIFVFYVLVTIVLSVILVYHYRPKLPETSTYTLLIWIGVCSMIGSLSVMSVKGLGLALMLTVSGIENELNNWLTWFCFVTLVVCVSVQMNFLNKALDTFNTAVVTPIYYVFFTSCVIIASAILFNEFANLPIKDWVGLACGFFTVLTAIVLLHLCKNFDFTLINLAQQIDLVNDSSSDHHHHQPNKGNSLTFPTTPLASTSSSAASNAIPVAISVVQEKGIKSQRGYNDNDSSDFDDVYKSIDSCNSPRCGNNGKKKASSSTPMSLSPDARLLSGSYSSSGGRNRDGYIPLSYGTTDNQCTNNF